MRSTYFAKDAPFFARNEADVGEVSFIDGRLYRSDALEIRSVIDRRHV